VTWFGVYVAACMLLAAAGAAKVVRPSDTARAVAIAVRGRRVSPTGGPGAVVRQEPGSRALRRWSRVVRTGAAAEVAVGVIGALWPVWWAATLVAGSYVLFVAFVVGTMVLGGPLSTCGCFGTPDTPPTMVHVVIDVGLATAAGAVAVQVPGRAALGQEIVATPWHGAPLLGAAAVTAYLLAAALTSLPRMEAARNPVRRGPPREEHER
jgi:hypothetical protein